MNLRFTGMVLALSLGLGGLVGEATAKSKFAVVNAGPADHATARRLLRVYEALEKQKRLSPLPKPPTAPVARPAPRTAPRPAARRGARPAPKRRAGTTWHPVKGRALRRALVGLPHDESLSLAMAALTRGQRLFTALKRQEAAEAFVQAIARLDRQVIWRVAKKPLIQAHTYLLLCYHALGRPAEGRPVALRLRELTANRRPTGIPAATWKAYPLQPIPLTPRRKVVVKAPPLARVYLDDRLAGTGPQTLHAGPGAHRVRVELDGHRVYFQDVAAAVKDQLVLVTLAPTAEDAYGDVRKSLAAVRKSGTPWKPEPYRALAKTLFVEYLLVVVRDGKRAQLRWFSRSLGRFASPSLAVTLPPATGAVPQLRAAVLAAWDQAREAERKDVELAAKADNKGRKATKKKSQIWKKWYFWVAAAVVGGVVAAFAIQDTVSEEKVILKITRP